MEVTLGIHESITFNIVLKKKAIGLKEKKLLICKRLKRRGVKKASRMNPDNIGAYDRCIDLSGGMRVIVIRQ